MPHLLDNSYVNLDILPGQKPEEMTDKAQETSEGTNTAGYVLCLLLPSFISLLLYADAVLVCAGAISRRLLPTFQVATKSRTPYPAELARHRRELALQGMLFSATTLTVASCGIDAYTSKTRS